MGIYLDRYHHGDYAEVWAELTNLGDIAKQEIVLDDAIQIASITMEKVKHNISILIPRLYDIGYKFREESVAYLEEQPIYQPPIPNADKIIEEIEDKAGTIPLSIKYFYKIVGTVNLVGEYANWKSCGYLDSLVVHSPRLALEWWEWNYGEEKESSTDIVIAPDEYHKVGQSGAGVYSITLPNKSVDALLEGEWHNTTFINYLRICFKWGGMPGLERCTNHPLADIEKLTRDLLPI